MTVHATTAVASDDVGFDINDFERLHRVCFTFREKLERGGRR
jgi:hypothetical protein